MHWKCHRAGPQTWFVPTLLGLLLAGTFCMPGRAQEQAPPAPSTFGVRYDGFQALFEFAKLRPGSLDAFRQGRPDEWIVVVVGEPAFAIGEIGDLARFVHDGGSLLIASDRPMRGPLNWWLGITIEAGPVLAGAPSDGYDGMAECPLITRWTDKHPLTVGVEKLALNLPGFLGGRNASRWALGSFSEGARIGRAPADPPPPAIATAELGAGRLLAISDQSLFINEMILLERADNLTFARNTVEWLVNGRERANLKVLFLADGVAVDQWIDPRFETGRWPTENELLRALGNELIAGLQSEDVFNRILMGGQEQIRLRWLRRAMLCGAALLAALALAHWLVRGRYHPSRTTTVSAAPAAAIGAPHIPDAAAGDGGLMLQRWDELSRLGNYVEPARRMARQLFVSPVPPVDWERRPRFIVNLPGFWRRWWIKRRLREFWRLAADLPVGKVREGRFRKFAQEAAQYSRWMEQGAIAVEWPTLE